MSHDSPAAELPKSLQSMIADAQQAIGNWGPEEETDSETLQSSQEWLLRLSRGEFEERLYWECLADDQEEAGDWQGALASHQKILGLPGLSSVECSKAHSAIALIQRLLGDYEAELAARRLATEKSDDGLGVLTRHCIADEAAVLNRLGHTRRARRLVHRTLAWRQSEGEIVDHLGIARLIIVSAMCDLARNKPAVAGEALRAAWEWLKVLTKTYTDEWADILLMGGIHLAYAWWWQAEARRRRLADEGLSELDALKNAIEEARLCFSPCGWQLPWNELTLMQLLLQIADAYARHDRQNESASARAEADEIFTRRRFPETARRGSSPQRSQWPAFFQKLLNRVLLK